MLLGCYGLAGFVSILSLLIILVLKGLLPAINFCGPRDFEVGDEEQLPSFLAILVCYF